MLTLEGVKLQRDGFSFSAKVSIGTGKKVAVIGPSGAGKSTLLDVVSGFAAPDAGRVVWNGDDLTNISPDKRPVTTIFQDHNVFPHLSVVQNVSLGIRPSLRVDPGESDRVSHALDKVGLQGFEDRKPGALSGGQQSRVALARMLVQRHPIVLLDEPFAALGPALRGEMLDLVAQLASDISATLLMVSHNPEDAKRIADETVLIVDGSVQPPVVTDDLFSNPPAALRLYLGG